MISKAQLSAPLQVELGFQLLHLPHFVLRTHLPLFPRNPNLKNFEMGKRGSSSGSTKLVIESRYKGLTVEEIVDDLRSKNREYVRLRQQRNSDLCISSSSPSSASSSGNVLTSEDNMQFDITNDGLRVSYSNKSKTPFRAETMKMKVFLVKREPLRTWVG
ncbi:hypothetical protein ARALYDRAFT_482797 [Arabidopsis lyrata subsp. lyrata]|uniref:Uncharacterized protein n=1 Tax=Arabidopsis lyrata subsp. lyrata TaxID=81972 RepID=D7LKQ6_ARALL|nr:hypothetical protein ARALYDRAFT_482797 [Arabidopsis lyrata subsp. lyrata]